MSDALIAALRRVANNYRLTLAGKPVRDADESLSEADAALAAAPEQQAEPVTAREVAQQVFALCESIEDKQDSAADSFGLARFTAGQRFAAKQIRRGIGTWLTDEENTRRATPAPAPIAQPQQPLTDEQITAYSRSVRQSNIAGTLDAALFTMARAIERAHGIGAQEPKP